MRQDSVSWTHQINIINVGLLTTYPWPPVSPAFPPGLAIQAGRM